MRRAYCGWVNIAIRYACQVLVVSSLVTSSAASIAQETPTTNTILRFVEGLDSSSQPMSAVDVKRELNDPWALGILRQGVFPTDVNAALSALDQAAVATSQESFFVSESGQIPLTPATSQLQREFRIVITRRGKDDSLPSILLSAPAGSRDGFIELMSWDPGKKEFNFYRRPTGGQWTWKGSTHDSVRSSTAGKGCFACHLNGVPVMKELKIPWNNWHSQSEGIPPEAITNDAIRNSQLWKQRSQAERLEPMIRGLIDQAMDARVGGAIQSDSVSDPPALLKSLFVTTTTNLTSSLVKSSAADDIQIPPSFFLNFGLLETDFRILKPMGFKTLVARAFYQDSLNRFDFRLQQQQVQVRGDTHFAFFVPEPSFEDISCVRQLVRHKVISPRFALCVLLVDFPNPIFSQRRERLLRYVPLTGRMNLGECDLSNRTAASILDAVKADATNVAEREFATWWEVSPDQLSAKATGQVQEYLKKIQTRLQSQAGVDDYTSLADTNRQRFAESSLDESPLLLPRTNIAPAARRMASDGDVTSQ
jgi:hypothetical protein